MKSYLYLVCLALIVFTAILVSNLAPLHGLPEGLDYYARDVYTHLVNAILFFLFSYYAFVKEAELRGKLASFLLMILSLVLMGLILFGALKNFNNYLIWSAFIFMLFFLFLKQEGSKT